MKKVVILILAVEPLNTLPNYVKGLRKEKFQDIIVVVDGSSDRHCFDELQDIGCVVLKHKVCEGKAEVLRAGLAYYKEHYKSDEYLGVISVDSEGQYLTKDVKKIADELESDSPRLILGIRDFSLSQVSFTSWLLNNLTTEIFKYLLQMNIRDAQTGLRGIPNDLIGECLRLSENRFEYETLMLMEVGKKAGIIEVPITTAYLDGGKGIHLRSILDYFKIYCVIFGTFFRYIFSAVSSCILDLFLFALFSKTVFIGLDHKIWLSTVVARLISACYNYCMNRKIVFKSDQPFWLSAVRYFGLCVVQGAISAISLSTLAKYLKMVDEIILKLMVDTVLFFISYQIQHRYIFRKVKRA